MLVVLGILVCCLTQVDANTPNENRDSSVMTFERSPTTPNCSQCINPYMCTKWLYTSSVSGLQGFEFCRVVTQQMQCLFDKQDNNDKLEKRMNDMETDLQMCTGNIQLTTINNQTTIENLRYLNVSVKNISQTLEMMKSKQDLRENELTSTVNRIDVQLKGLQLDIDSSKTAIANITVQLSSLESETTKIQEKQKSHFDTLGSNLETSLRTEIQTRNTELKEQILDSVEKSKSQIINQLEALKEETDKNIFKMKSDLLETDSQRKSLILELSDNITRLRESLAGQIEETEKLLGDKVQNLHDDFETEKSHLTTVETSLKSEFNSRLAEVVGELNLELRDMMLDSENRLEEIKMNMRKEKQEVQDKTDSIDRNIDTIKSDLQMQIDTMKQELQSSIDKQRTALDKKLDNMSETFKKELQVINITHTQYRNDIEAILNDQENHFQKADNNMQDSIKENTLKLETETKRIESDVYEKISSLKEDISTQIVNEVEKLRNQTKEVNQTVTKQKEMVDIIYPNTFNKEMFQMAFLFLVVLVLINFAIVYCLVKNSHTSTHMSQSAVARNSIMGNSNVPHSPTEVMSRFQFSSMPNSVSLELRNAITVVSFYEDAQTHHKRLVKSVVLPEQLSSQLRIDYHVVRRHEDISSMPLSKLFLMFVEFSERHVIIEEPGLGLGDLKRRTAEAITNIGACLVIVYVKDPGSRRLAENKFFNDGIYCVTSQPELKVLHKHDRFLSIYDKFTEFQRERLAQIIEANIDVSDVQSTPKGMSKSMHSLH